MTPRRAGIDEARVPRSVVRRDRVLQLIIVRPPNRSPRGHLDAFLRKLHRANLSRGRICRRSGVLRRLPPSSAAEVSAQCEGDGELKPAPHAIDAARRALQRGGVRVRDLQRHRVRRVGNRELQSRAPGNFFPGTFVDQRGDVARECDPAMQPQRGAAADGVPRRIAVVAVREESADGHGAQRTEDPRRGQLGVATTSCLVVTAL